MELFKMFFCNSVYYHRHCKYGHRDLPILATLGLMYISLMCYSLLGVVLLNMYVVDVPTSLFRVIVIILIPVFIVYCYWRIMGNKRYMGILRNRKYYSRRCKVISVLFPLLSFVCLLLAAFLMWARNNELI